MAEKPNDYPENLFPSLQSLGQALRGALNVTPPVREITVSASRADILVDVDDLRDEQWNAGYTEESDDNASAEYWRQEREIQENRAMQISRPHKARRRALLKLIALAVAQIEAMDRRASNG